jgi:hypothetical protein
MTEDGCIICNSELIYYEKSEKMNCIICGHDIESNARCINGHFICDACHELEGFDYIEKYCKNITSANPIDLATSIMSNPKIKLHGPEHHFLVPAVLITAYYNKIGKSIMIPEKIEIARARAKNVLGGFCGFYGNCGAGVGTGIFLSVILNTTPLSGEEWRLSNLITSSSLYVIAMNGGPRCCKRDTYLSLETAIRFIEEFLKVKLDSSEIECTYYCRNKECRQNKCKFFPTYRHGAQYHL